MARLIYSITQFGDYLCIRLNTRIIMSSGGSSQYEDVPTGTYYVNVGSLDGIRFFLFTAFGTFFIDAVPSSHTMSQYLCS